MKRQSTNEPVEHSAAVTDGPIKSERPDTTTTVWRDGETWRQDQFGRAHRLQNIKPIFATAGGAS